MYITYTHRLPALRIRTVCRQLDLTSLWAIKFQLERLRLLAGLPLELKQVK